MTAQDAFITREEDGRVERVDIPAGGQCSIGRADHNLIWLQDLTVSREHCIIRSDAAGTCYLTDTGSSNGTLVNGTPVHAPKLLRDGDVIGIGRYRLVFRQPSSSHVPAETLHQGTQIDISFRTVTVLLLDIRDSTVLAQELGEERFSSLIAEVFRTAGALLDAKRSWSQKYIGDAVMGVWIEDDPASQASRMAGLLGIVLQMRDLFQKLEAEYGLERPFRFGAAINTGPASIGNMGSASLKDFTALGDAVTKTFRLESATKQLGCDLILGRSVVHMFEPRPQITHAFLKGYECPEELAAFKFDDIPTLMSSLPESDQTFVRG